MTRTGLLLATLLFVSASCRGDGCSGSESLEGPTLEYSIDDDGVPASRLRVHGRRLALEVNEESPAHDLEATYDAGELVVGTAGPEQASLVQEVVDEKHGALEQVGRDGDQLRFTLTEEAVESYRSSLLPGTARMVDGRLHNAGFPEARAVPRADNTIVVELPERAAGELDRAKEAVRNFQTLRFVFVDDDRAETYFPKLESELPEEFQVCDVNGVPSVVHEGRREAREAMESFFEGRVPEDRTIGYELVVKEDDSAGSDDQESGGESVVLGGGDSQPDDAPCRLNSTHWRTYLLEGETKLESDHILATRVSVDEKTQRPVVSITFTDEGGELLAEITRQNVQRRFAMVVGHTVHTAPMINESIPGGRLQLSMGTLKNYETLLQESKDLNDELRAQSAPIELELSELKRGDEE
jgi:preprotein translocase subunit SecD